MKRIVVGTDGSEGAAGALAWAAAEARQWGATLEVVMAWSYLDQPTEEFRPDYGEDDARAALDAAVAAVDTTGVEVLKTLVNDLPARSLIAAAEGAGMVVVGSRGLGGFKGLLLGSVSQQVALHAPCPVLIVHPGDLGPEPQPS